MKKFLLPISWLARIICGMVDETFPFLLCNVWFHCPMLGDFLRAGSRRDPGGDIFIEEFRIVEFDLRVRAHQIEQES